MSRCRDFLAAEWSGTSELTDKAIDCFVQSRLMIREGDIVLSLALPENYQW